MSEPIVFISNQKIKEGKLDGYKQYFHEMAELIDANEPGTVAYLAYLDERGTRASVVHVFPNAESMELHMQGVGDRAKGAFEFTEIVSIVIYGRPSDTVLETMKKIRGSGVALNIKPQPLGGYIRFRPG